MLSLLVFLNYLITHGPPPFTNTSTLTTTTYHHFSDCEGSGVPVLEIVGLNSYKFAKDQKTRVVQLQWMSLWDVILPCWFIHKIFRLLLLFLVWRLLSSNCHLSAKLCLFWGLTQQITGITQETTQTNYPPHPPHPPHSRWGPCLSLPAWGHVLRSLREGATRGKSVGADCSGACHGRSLRLGARRLRFEAQPWL